MTEFNDRIVPLDDLDDFEVAEGDPDVRGWEVIASDGRRIGEVDELLVDTEALKVRYLDVDVDHDLLGTGSNEDRHILIPIGYARLDENDDQVLVDHLASTEVGTLPAYNHEPISRDFEMSVVSRFSRDDSTPAPGGELYDLDHYDEGRFYGSRRGNPLA